MKNEIESQINAILAGYDPDTPKDTAVALRRLWLQTDERRSLGIKAEQQAAQETLGIPIADLKKIGKAVGKTARKQVAAYIPLMQLLWDEYGREGRVVALIPLGAMELRNPERIVPLLRELCRTCHTWEDCDRLAMDAFEPIVRKQPETWLPAAADWLADENKWLRRAGVTVIGRLPMKHPAYTGRCLELTERLLLDKDSDVRRAVSFAIRISTRGEIPLVRDFLARHVPPADAAATWVLCDAIRSMTNRFLPEFAPLIPHYEAWLADPSLSTRDRRSVESALRRLGGGR